MVGYGPESRGFWDEMDMELRERIGEALKTAMREKDTMSLSTTAIPVERLAGRVTVGEDTLELDGMELPLPATRVEADGTAALGAGTWAADGRVEVGSRVLRWVDPELPSNARICFFHGRFDPWDALPPDMPWLRAHWR